MFCLIHLKEHLDVPTVTIRVCHLCGTYLKVVCDEIDIVTCF